jgi:pSer/pThr/pTyr-binding forkhead associated (FHA) protein
MGEEDTKAPGGESKKPEGSLPANLKIYLEVLEGSELGAKFELNKLSTSLGRKNCDIMLTDPAISSQHCVIEVNKENITLYDNNSTNGTFVNGEKVSACPLSNMDEIRIGESKLLLSVVSDPYAMYEQPAATVEIPGYKHDEATMVMGEGSLNPELAEDFQAVVEVVVGPNKGERFKLMHRSTVIGRKDADINLSDEAVSSRHCQIEVHSKDKITVKDLASTNGTRVNNMLVSAVKIRSGDSIEIGKTKMTFYFRLGK